MSPDIQKKLIELAEAKSKRDALPGLIMQAKTQLEKFGDRAAEALGKVNGNPLIKNAGIRFEVSAEYDCGHREAFGGYTIRLVRGINFKPSLITAFISPLVLADTKLKLNVRYFKYYPYAGGMESAYRSAKLCYALVNRNKEDNWAQISRGELESEMLMIVDYEDIVPRWQDIKQLESTPATFEEVITSITSTLIALLSDY